MAQYQHILGCTCGRRFRSPRHIICQRWSFYGSQYFGDPAKYSRAREQHPQCCNLDPDGGKVVSEHLGLQFTFTYLRVPKVEHAWEWESKGPVALSDERWRSWAQKFGELTGRSDLSEEARDWASQAAEYMSESQ